MHMRKPALNLKSNMELIPTPSVISKPRVIIVKEAVSPRVATTGTVCPRRGNQTIVRIKDANRRNDTVNRAPRTDGQSSRSINGHSKDVVLRRVLREEEEQPLGPTHQSIGQALVHLRTFLISPNVDILVELPEELEGEFCDLEFAE